MTKFTKDQVKLLEEKLNSKHVSKRNQGGVNLSYIEGYHAIDEANRIFGFDGWSITVDSITTMAISKIKIGAKKVDGHHVGMMAQVTITAGGVSRTDVGYGSDRKVSEVDAYELASKEAVTDAIKRALRTFGNQFGNALYDKTQKNVVDDAKVKREKKASKPKKETKAKTESKAKATNDDSKAKAKEFASTIKGLKTEEEFITFRKTNRDDIKSLEKEDYDKVVAYYTKMKGKV